MKYLALALCLLFSPAAWAAGTIVGPLTVTAGTPIHIVVADQNHTPLAPAQITTVTPAGNISGCSIGIDATGFTINCSVATPAGAGTLSVVGPTALTAVLPIIVTGTAVTGLTFLQQ